MAVPKIRAKNVSPEVTLTWRPTDDLTLFGAWKQGYKSGSFNVSTPPFTGENNAFGDEKVQGGEVGLKSRWLDRTLLFNLAAYDYKYTGLQVGANVQSNAGVTVTRTVNAGAARDYGVEADVSYSPEQFEGLSLNASLNYNHGRYSKLDNLPCYGGQTIAAGCNELYSPTANGGLGGYTSESRSGVPMFRAPDWQGTFGFSWEKPISDFTLVLASNTYYSSKYVADLGYLWYQKAFAKTDASVTLRSPNDRWEVALIGKNLNNALTSGTCANSNSQAGQTGGQITGSTGAGPAGIDEVGCYMDRGREIWVRFTWKPFN
jgi:iron complex outermembrane receptor protein